MTQNEIICGDCLGVMKDWPDKCIDLVLTDPPYGMKMDSAAHKKSGRQYGPSATKNTDYIDTNWDNDIPDKDEFDNILRISQNQILWGGQYYTAFLKPSRCWLLWDKRDNNMSNCYGDGEMAWTSFDKPIRIFRYLWNGMIQENMANKDIRVHPTQKPVALGLWILENYSKPDDLILDCYCGSGSFCVAAKMLGRRYIGIDISEEYCKIARQRLEAVDTGVPVKEQKSGQLALFPKSE